MNKVTLEQEDAADQLVVDDIVRRIRSAPVFVNNIEVTVADTVHFSFIHEKDHNPPQVVASLFTTDSHALHFASCIVTGYRQHVRNTYFVNEEAKKSIKCVQWDLSECISRVDTDFGHHPLLTEAGDLISKANELLKKYEELIL